MLVLSVWLWDACVLVCAQLILFKNYNKLLIAVLELINAFPFRRSHCTGASSIVHIRLEHIEEAEKEAGLRAPTMVLKRDLGASIDQGLSVEEIPFVTRQRL